MCPYNRPLHFLQGPFLPFLSLSYTVTHTFVQIFNPKYYVLTLKHNSSKTVCAQDMMMQIVELKDPVYTWW